MSNHLAKYYMHLFFIVLLICGAFVTSILNSFAEMLGLHDASYNLDIILSGFNGALIIALFRSWRSIDREITRRLNQSPLNQIEKEWLEKNSRYLRFFKSEQSQTKPVRYAKASRFKIHLLIVIVLLANILSLSSL